MWDFDFNTTVAITAFKKEYEERKQAELKRKYGKFIPASGISGIGKKKKDK